MGPPGEDVVEVGDLKRGFPRAAATGERRVTALTRGGLIQEHTPGPALHAKSGVVSVVASASCAPRVMEAAAGSYRCLRQVYRPRNGYVTSEARPRHRWSGGDSSWEVSRLTTLSRCRFPSVIPPFRRHSLAPGRLQGRRSVERGLVEPAAPLASNQLTPQFRPMNVLA